MDGIPLLALFLVCIVAVFVHRPRGHGRREVLVAAFVAVPLVLFSVYSSGEIARATSTTGYTGPPTTLRQ